MGYGWATDDELKDFRETAHPHRHGKPADPIRKGRREISLEEARELVRRLLTRWAQELAP